MASSRNCIISSLLIFLAFFCIVEGKSPKQKFEKDYSFHSALLPKFNGSIPGWEYDGDAFLRFDHLRLTPDKKDKRGAVWTKSPTKFRWWQVKIMFRITGFSAVGGDGLAFWYTKDKGTHDGGTVFGSSDRWVGLGVFFDTYDNNDKDDNPFAGIIINDGSKQFDHENDGLTQLNDGCRCEIRNTPHPTHITIEYYLNTLQITFHNGMGDIDFMNENCVRKENVYLPEFGYFGISAATGGLAGSSSPLSIAAKLFFLDNHDVHQFLTVSLTTTDLETLTVRPLTSDEWEMLIQDYETNYGKLDGIKEEQTTDTPLVKKEPFWHKTDDLFKIQDYSEIRNTVPGKDGIYASLNYHLMEDLENLFGYTTTTTKQTYDSLEKTNEDKQKVDQEYIHVILKNVKNVAASIHELKDLVAKMNIQIDGILQHQAEQLVEQALYPKYDVHDILTEFRQGLTVIKEAIFKFSQHSAQLYTCSSCVSSVAFLSVTAIQMIFIVAYITCRRREGERPVVF